MRARIQGMKITRKIAIANTNPVVIGREGMAKTNAVDGRHLLPDMKALVEDFDRRGLSADEWRREIVQRFGK